MDRLRDRVTEYVFRARLMPQVQLGGGAGAAQQQQQRRPAPQQRAAAAQQQQRQPAAQQAPASDADAQQEAPKAPAAPGLSPAQRLRAGAGRPAAFGAGTISGPGLDAGPREDKD
jgi:hypothetical protein